MVARLRAAGALILGKLNMDEFAMGSSTENSALRPDAQPLGPEPRARAARRGGSAAAVAARMALGALGTDTGGSIRQPAALCGVVGLKPTYGRVSRYGVIAFASSLDQVGPFARDVADAAALLQAIARPRPARLHLAPTCRSPDYLRRRSRAAVRGAAAGRAARVLRRRAWTPRSRRRCAPPSAGCERARAPSWSTSRCRTPSTRSPPTTSSRRPRPRANLARYDGVRYGLPRRRTRGPAASCTRRPAREGFGAEVKRRIMLGTYALSAGYYDAYYLKAQKVRTLIRRDFDAGLRAGATRCVSPTSPTPAFKLGEKVDDPLAMYLADVFTLPVQPGRAAGHVACPAASRRRACRSGCRSSAGRSTRPALLRVGRAYEREHRLAPRAAPPPGGRAMSVSRLRSRSSASRCTRSC